MHLLDGERKTPRRPGRRQYSGGNFSAIHWNFPRLVEYASRGTELRTGDIIGSGTVGEITATVTA